MEMGFQEGRGHRVWVPEKVLLDCGFSHQSPVLKCSEPRGKEHLCS